MAQKKQKKLKVEKSKKPSKPAKVASKASGSAGLLKKAAKAVAKKVAAIGGKAPKKTENPKAVKKAGAPVAKKVQEKPAKKAAGPTELKSKKVEKVEVKAKGKSAPAAAPAVPAKAGKPAKKGKEVVVEVLAPKVVPLLTKESKKKAKLAEALKKKCREPGCEHDHLIAGFCRLHYIKNWKKIKRKEAILASGQLNNYVEELVSKYPDRYLDVIRQDLASEKDWSKVVVDLELDAADEDASGEEDLEGVAEGVGRARDFDDEGDAF